MEIQIKAFLWKNSKSDLHFSFNPGSDIWTIKDPQGNVYEFAYYEDSSYDPGNCESDENHPSYNGTTSWYLTKISSYDNTDQIIFSYSTSEFDLRLNQATSTTFTKPIQNTNCNEQTCPTTYTSCIPVVYADNIKLDRIDASFYSVLFDYDTERNDLLNAYKLNKISLVQKNSIGNVLKSYDLQYNYFGNSNRNRRLKLMSIKEMGFDGMSNPPYVFSYTGTPIERGNAQDHWGFQRSTASTNIWSLPNVPATGYDLSIEPAAERRPPIKGP